MEIYVLNQELEVISVVDTYTSLIWTIRYSSYGDFELECPVTQKNYDAFKIGRYLQIPTSDRTMIIETSYISKNALGEHTIKLKGRSLESILDRRIIHPQVTIVGSVQDGIERLLNESIINPIRNTRKIDNFKIDKATDKEVLKKTTNKVYENVNLYDTIKELCDLYMLGFKIILDNNDFVFSLYSGVNRSGYSEDVSPVYISYKLDNLNELEIIETSEQEKNAIISGYELDDKKYYLYFGSGEGLERRELYSEDTDSSNSGYVLKNSNHKSLSVYPHSILKQLSHSIKDKAVLIKTIISKSSYLFSENKYVRYMNGTVLDTGYKIDEDYFLGDVVSVLDDYQVIGKMRVSEVCDSYDNTGYKKYPTYEFVANIFDNSHNIIKGRTHMALSKYKNRDLAIINFKETF